MVYCKGTQVYAGTNEQSFFALQPGQPVFGLDHDADAGALLQVTASMLREANLGKYFLEQLSKVWEKEFLKLERSVEYAAGYTSKLITGSKTRDLAYNLGALRGHPKARLEPDGTLWF